MDKPKHIALLEFLSENNTGSSKNVSPWIAVNFPLPVDYKENRQAWNSQLLSVISMLTDLQSRKFIKYDTEGFDVISFTPQYDGVWPLLVWYSDETDLVYQNKFFLTSKGVDYLDKYQYAQLSKELLESNKTVNASIVVNNIHTRNALFLTAGISLVTLVLSALSYKVSKSSLDLNVKNSYSDSLNNIMLYRRLDTLQSRIYSLQQTIWSYKTK